MRKGQGKGRLWLDEGCHGKQRASFLGPVSPLELFELIAPPPLQFRFYMRETNESATNEIELFLNSVPILTPLSSEEKARLVDAFEEKTFGPGVCVIQQGEPGDLFYIIKEGEAVVFEEGERGPRKVNHLFKADFFGEKALLSDEPRAATIESVTKLVCLTLQRQTFVELLGPLQDLMAREKSEEVVSQRMTKLMNKGTPSNRPAEVFVFRPASVTGASKVSPLPLSPWLEFVFRFLPLLLDCLPDFPSNLIRIVFPSMFL